MMFFPPEMEIVKQFDDNQKSVMIIGTGHCNIYRYFDAKNKLILGSADQGYIFGESQAIHDNVPVNGMDTRTYCAIGMIKF